MVNEWILLRMEMSELQIFVTESAVLWPGVSCSIGLGQFCAVLFFFPLPFASEGICLSFYVSLSKKRLLGIFLGLFVLL